MKRHILIIVCLLFALGLKSQSVTCRYWYDFDHEQAVITAFEGNIWQAALDVGSLPDGVHTLHFQAVDTSMAWSSPQSFLFLKMTPPSQSDVLCHYWFDDDDDDLQSCTLGNGLLPLDVNSLSDGIHTLHVMMKSNDYSTATSFLFMKMAVEPEAAEVHYHYWFNEDDSNLYSGLLNGGLLPLDVSGLPEGIHALHVMMDGNGYSSTSSFLFMRMPIEAVSADVHYHYWFDEDGDSLQSGLYGDGILPLDVTGLTEGLHTLHVMMEGSGLTSVQSFLFLRMEIASVAAETQYHYWFDEDDANIQSGLFGEGLLIVDASELSDGPHVLNVIIEGNKMSAPQSFEFIRWANLVFTGNVNTLWSELGNWSGSAWSGTSLPGIGDNIVIEAPCDMDVEAAIDNLYVPDGNTLTIQSGSILTVVSNLANTEASGLVVEGGGQLRHDNEGVQATVQRTISTYTGEKDNYNLIASPMTNDLTISDETQTNLIVNNYDLYKFNQYYDLEWRNYENGEFTNLSNGTGYLYANSGEEGQTTYTINLSGELEPSNADKSINLDYYDGHSFTGWNLIGNPFACNAYIGQDFYRLGEGAVDATPASGEIAPMEGVFVKATGTNQTITFSRNQPEGSGIRGVLDVNVMSKGNRVDLARVRFGEGQGLEKFQLNPNHTKVFIPQNGKDYAVTYSEANAGEMPLSFKAEENGSYTLEFSNEEITFDYLHLIDNMTGADVDLLNTPSYTFTAKTTDYASRFKLVFATGNNSNEDSFAFFSNGSFVINNEGDATLQVIDVTGRIVQNESINGCANVKVNAAVGVYMLRLVNGNSVKVQKVVVR